MGPEFPQFSDPQVSPCWWSRKDTLRSKALKYKSLAHLQRGPSPPLHGLCNNHQSNPAQHHLRFTEESRDVPVSVLSGSPGPSPGLLVLSPQPAGLLS